MKDPFVVYDLTILVLFSLFVFLFLLKNKKKIKREGLFFLYRTKTGLKAIDRLTKKFKNVWKSIGTLVVVLGFIFMVLIFILLIQSVFLTFKMPTKAPPVMPLLPYVPQAFKMPLPPLYFTYWLIIVAVIAITHEFAHGIFARLHKVKVKSTGFGFLGPFLLAFVEPDEKEMERKKKKAQLEILAAGSFSNFVFAIFFIILLQLFSLAVYIPDGVGNYVYAYTTLNFSEIKSIGNYSLDAFLSLPDNELEKINERLEVKTENKSYWIDPSLIKTIPFYKKTIVKQKVLVVYEDTPAYRANLSGGIKKIDGNEIKSIEDISKVLAKTKPNQTISIETSVKNYTIKLDENKNKPGTGYLGIAFPRFSKTKLFLYKMTSPFFSPYLYLKPRFNKNVIKFFSDLFLWLILVCFFVALFNMLPFGFLDGGKFIYVSALALTKSKKKAERILKISSSITSLIFVALIFAWLLG